ncbi:ornithine carbamoyltransferase [Microbacterium sp. KUDC0406]|uniref:ornithine carbamoyltransferase n=1 Tax=Microbacterium sp. KUDC0406 TaxID=2909588 RepID=UPI001F3F91EC|nr:ornithine carbamoyltransferase [Microbacterium sp. KUDC0406]UJP11349.1 ornithine carbamoyltransferase [Microbacterium sp. KUDC0406]
MRHLIRLSDWDRADVERVFALADEHDRGAGPRREGCAVMFFPPSSLRTRVSLERGAQLMGLQPIVFPPESLEKPEALADVAGYLASWADVLIVRQRMQIIEELAASSPIPVINAMTELNHPCEVLGDVYALGRTRDPQSLRFLFVGADGNIARAWQEIAVVLGLDLVQCCPGPIATPGAEHTDDLARAITTADVIITDGPGQHAEALAPFRITAALLDTAPAGAQFIPCPPHLAGREAAADAFRHPALAGHGFKSSLLPVQQAVMSVCLD